MNNFDVLLDRVNAIQKWHENLSIAKTILLSPKIEWN